MRSDKGAQRLLLAVVLGAIKDGDTEWMQAEGIPALKQAGYIDLASTEDALKEYQKLSRQFARTRQAADGRRAARHG